MSRQIDLENLSDDDVQYLVSRGMPLPEGVEAPTPPSMPGGARTPLTAYSDDELLSELNARGVISLDTEEEDEEDDGLDKLNRASLAELAKEKGLSGDGTRSELIERIRSASA